MSPRFADEFVEVVQGDDCGLLQLESLAGKPVDLFLVDCLM